MYELWLTDGHYIQGRKVGKACKTISTLKKRAAKELKDDALHFDDKRETEDKCIWIDQGELYRPVGLICPKGP